MYYIKDFTELGRPRIVRMSFEMPYLDWCRFEKSKIFRSLVKYLSELEKKEIPNAK